MLYHIYFIVLLFVIYLYGSKYPLINILQKNKNSFITIVLFICQCIPYYIFNMYFVPNNSLLINIIDIIYIFCLALFFMFIMKKKPNNVNLLLIGTLAISVFLFFIICVII